MSTTRHPRRSALLRTACIVVAVTAGGCDRAPTAPGDLLVNEIILAVDDGTYAFSHTDHWHGAPAVRAGSAVSMTMYFTSVRLPADEHDPPPPDQWFTLEGHPEYNVRAVVEDTTIGRWTGDRTRGTLEGLRAGASRITFVVRRGTTTIYEAPPLNFVVQPALTAAEVERRRSGLQGLAGGGAAARKSTSESAISQSSAAQAATFWSR